MPPVGSKLLLGKRGDLLAVDDDTAVGETVHPAEDVQEGGLPGTGFPDDDADLAPFDVKAGIMQRGHSHFSRLIYFSDPVKPDKSLSHESPSVLYAINSIIQNPVCQEQEWKPSPWDSSPEGGASL